MKTDTPRTDVEAGITIADSMGLPYTADLVEADFARSLEREITRLKASNAELVEALQYFVDWDDSDQSFGGDIDYEGLDCHMQRARAAIERAKG